MTTNRAFSYKPLWKLLIDRDIADICKVVPTDMKGETD